MNKEFIPYEQALELKELGFNENCFASYTYDRSNEGAMAFDIKEQNGLRWSTNTNEQCKQYKEPCTAPTFSQAFRWFREKGFVNSVRSHNDKCHEYYLIHNGKASQSWNYSTYEEAEQLLLKTLIKIAKTTNT